MRKKKLISQFNDQKQYKNNIGAKVFPTKMHGDEVYEINDSEASLNFKNEKAKIALILTESLPVNEYYSTNLVKNIDSSKDNEYYFDRYEKFLNLNFSFFSATYVDPASATFAELDRYGTASNASYAYANDIAVHPYNGTLYVAGNDPRTSSANRGILRSFSANTKQFSTIDSLSGGLDGATNPYDVAYKGVAVSPIDGAVYVCGAENTATGLVGFVRRSSTGASGTFSTALIATGSNGNTSLAKITISPIDGAVYAVGYRRTTGVLVWEFACYRSATGASGTFSVVDSIITGSDELANAQDVAVSPIDGAVYVAGYASDAAGNCIVRRSTTGASGTFSIVERSGSGMSGYSSVAVSPIDGAVYACNNSLIRRSATGASGTFSTVSTIGGNKIYISPFDGSVWCFGDDDVLTSRLVRSTTGASGTFSIVSSSYAYSYYSGLVSPSGAKIYAVGQQSNNSGKLFNWIVVESQGMIFAPSDIVILTGTTSAQFKRSFLDNNNAVLVSGLDYFSSNYPSLSVFNCDNFFVHKLLNATFKMSVSGVSETFNSNNINIKFKDDVTFSYRDITSHGFFLSSSIPGWIDFYYPFLNSGTYIAPSMSFASVQSSLMVSASSGKTYAFRDAKLYFHEALTPYGVSFYKNIDNQHNKDIFTNIKYSGKKID